MHEVRRGTSSSHFHRTVPQSSSHIGLQIKSVCGNRKNEVKLRPPLCCPLKHSMRRGKCFFRLCPGCCNAPKTTDWRVRWLDRQIYQVHSREQMNQFDTGIAQGFSNVPWHKRAFWPGTKLEAKKINANFFCTKFFNNPSGHARQRRKSWTSAPRSVFFCGPGDGEKLFDPRASGRKGQERPQEIRTEKFMFMLFFLP